MILPVIVVVCKALYYLAATVSQGDDRITDHQTPKMPSLFYLL